MKYHDTLHIINSASPTQSFFLYVTNKLTLAGKSGFFLSPTAITETKILV